MIVYYAAGGGLGHATRARRVLDALHLHDAVVVTSADLPPALEGDVDAHRQWIRALGAERIIADAFPLGIQGELAGIGTPMDYVARLLRWDEYRRAVPDPLPRFGTVYVVEPLTHTVDADRVIDLPLSVEDRRPRLSPLPYDYWLVVHSGPEDEVRDLIAYAEELQRLEGTHTKIAVATQCDIEGRLDAVPAWPLFAKAQRIVSAAGFNVMLETEPWRDKHHVVPMPRRFDDQFTRAARRRLLVPSL